ncbi:hypothetical protein EBR43_03665 [bacterium]|nr:hypothetical protein [bacterium]NBW56876.1 hypothetical protein [bacterium]NBX72625.1 hypothetical protein [bacterium]
MFILKQSDRKIVQGGDLALMLKIGQVVAVSVSTYLFTLWEKSRQRIVDQVNHEIHLRQEAELALLRKSILDNNTSDERSLGQ